MKKSLFYAILFLALCPCIQLNCAFADDDSTSVTNKNTYYNQQRQRPVSYNYTHLNGSKPSQQNFSNSKNTNTKYNSQKNRNQPPKQNFSGKNNYGQTKNKYNNQQNYYNQQNHRPQNRNIKGNNQQYKYNQQYRNNQYNRPNSSKYNSNPNRPKTIDFNKTNDD